MTSLAAAVPVKLVKLEGVAGGAGASTAGIKVVEAGDGSQVSEIYIPRLERLTARYCG